MVENRCGQVEKSVFIITYGRSGSTLLQNMLNALPGYCLRGENANLLAPLVRAWHGLRHSDQAASMRARGTPSGPHQPWFGYEAIEADSFGQEIAGTFLRTVLRPEPDTRVLGFKEIRWHEDPALFQPMLEFLARYMPQAHFIFNTRNHGEVRNSGWWRSMKRAAVLEQLETAEALYRRWQSAHPQCSLAMHYDEYARDPAAWRPLFAFLDEPYDRVLVESVLERKLLHMKWQKPAGGR